MQIIKYIDLFVGALINIIICIYLIKTIFNPKENSIKSKILYVVLSAFFISLINIINKDAFKLIFAFPFLVLSIKGFFKIDWNKSIIYSIAGVIYVFIAELIIICIISMLHVNNMVFNNILGTIIGNTLVALFIILLSYIKPLNRFIFKITKSIGEKGKIIQFVFLLIICALAYRNFISAQNFKLLIMNMIITIVFVFMFYMYYKENMKLKELSNKYNELFEYLDKYEKELVEKRKIIHDYKNQLIVINGYIGNDVKLKEYLNEIINEQKNVSENSIIKNIDKLPRGLKGLIYYKFSHMNKSDVVDLNVNGSLKKFDKLPPKTNKDVLKIIGILVDNAIESIDSEKNKYINIKFTIKKDIFNMYMENSCDKNININNIMESGFSTKGKKRGYGMALVNDILKQNKDIELNINIKDNTFISNLKVFIK